MMLTEKPITRPSGSGRLFLLVLMAALAAAAALLMAFAADARAQT